MNRKQITLQGLTCADCANKIEAGIKELDSIKDVNLNFSTSILTVNLKDNESWEEAHRKILSIISKYDNSIKLTYKKDYHPNIHSHNSNDRKFSKDDIFIGIGVVLFLLSMVFTFNYPLNLLLFVGAYLFIGGQVLLMAGKNILRGQVFDENFLMSIATLGAFAIGEYPEGVAVMLFYQVGEFFQDLAVNRSRKSIHDLMDIRPDYANLKAGDNISKVDPSHVNIGDLIIVKPGEKVPLDGIIIEGKAMMDTSALTGESIPRNVGPGSQVLSGFINNSGLITLEVTKNFHESTVSKILELVENTSSKKATTEQFITKFSRFYTPIVVFIALGIAIFPPLVLGGGFSQWIYKSLVFLVISCPCALVISVPLGFFGGIGSASKNGILVKGGNYLEALNNIDMMIFDKTGTLTKGTFEVIKVHSHGDFSDNDLLYYAAHGEYYSNHPIAKSIVKRFDGIVNKGDISNYEEISGFGIRATIKGKDLFLGNDKLMSKENIEFTLPSTVGTIVHGAINNQYMGYIVISDELKADSKDTIKALKSLGIRKNIMLTGDNEVLGENIAKELSLDAFYAGLLPQEKVERLEQLDKEKIKGKNLAFVGDGINDAPVIVRADIGIAMGGLGSDAAIEAADIVLMTDEPSKLIKAIKIARFTRNIVMQNIIFALTVKIGVLILGALGYATMWLAVFADVGVSLIAILNSLRVITNRYK